MPKSFVKPEMAASIGLMVGQVNADTCVVFQSHLWLRKAIECEGK